MVRADGIAELALLPTVSMVGAFNRVCLKIGSFQTELRHCGFLLSPALQVFGAPAGFDSNLVFVFSPGTFQVLFGLWPAGGRGFVGV